MKKLKTLSDYTRLQELEDKIENGTLVELPCKVGDTVYAIMMCEDYRYHTIEFKARNIELGEYGIYFNTPTGVEHKLTFGINVFTDKAQAEARLKELKGDK